MIMTKTQLKLILLMVLMGLSACRTKEGKETPDSAQGMGQGSQGQDLDYIDGIRAWQGRRTASLKADDGWLNLAGLYWLVEGENTVGSGEAMDLRFPQAKADSDLGRYILKDGTLSFTASQGQRVGIKGTERWAETIKVYPLDSLVVLTHRRLEWFPIKRGDQFGIRLRDLDSELAKSFTGVETFEVDPKWRVKAKFEPTPSKTISILNVLDQESDQTSPGVLHFDLEGKAYRLDALQDGDSLFIIFGDATNGDQTYGSGRFLYTSSPDAQGYVWLDFNKAYNPPCAFTPYSTCPLPPRQNILPVAIPAGEKDFP